MTSNLRCSFNFIFFSISYWEMRTSGRNEESMTIRFFIKWRHLFKWKTISSSVIEHRTRSKIFALKKQRSSSLWWSSRWLLLLLFVFMSSCWRWSESKRIWTFLSFDFRYKIEKKERKGYLCAFSSTQNTNKERKGEKTLFVVTVYVDKVDDGDGYEIEHH